MAVQKPERHSWPVNNKDTTPEEAQFHQFVQQTDRQISIQMWLPSACTAASLVIERIHIIYKVVILFQAEGDVSVFLSQQALGVGL